jgi:hypothetical protein
MSVRRKAGAPASASAPAPADVEITKKLFSDLDLADISGKKTEVPAKKPANKKPVIKKTKKKCGRIIDLGDKDSSSSEEEEECCDDDDSWIVKDDPADDDPDEKGDWRSQLDDWTSKVRRGMLHDKFGDHSRR